MSKFDRFAQRPDYGGGSDLPPGEPVMLDAERYIAVVDGYAMDGPFGHSGWSSTITDKETGKKYQAFAAAMQGGYRNGRLIYDPIEEISGESPLAVVSRDWTPEDGYGPF